MKFLCQPLFLIILFLFTENLNAQNCPADLTNEDSTVSLNAGNSYSWSSLAGVTGVSSASETNGSPCALKLEQDGSAGTYNNWTINIDFGANGNNIDVGDELVFSIDGNGISGNARVIIRSDASNDNLVFKQFGQNNGWETHTQSFIVPAGATKLFIKLYPNVGSGAAGASLYDNLDLFDATVDGGGGTSFWTQAGTDIHYTTGNVGIGTSNPDAPLTVNGRIHTTEVKVDASVPAPDYVFYEDYDLKTLEGIH